MSAVRVRFAPSPTGPLHVGGARTALFNFLFARASGGTFVVRIDDTDRERSHIDFEDEIFVGLEWLGLSWDEGPQRGGDYGPYRQSERLGSHEKAAEKLLASGAAYQDPEGTVRLRYPAAEIVFDDIVCGECKFAVPALGPEPVLLRADGSPTYHLATVADDIEMNITHVLRGQDHLTNTAKHVLLFRALGGKLPHFAHLPLILGKDGGKLSKRDSSTLVSLREFRAAGYVPEAMINFLLLLGWSHPEAYEQINVDEAIRSFTLDRVGRTAALFDETKLHWLNGWWVRNLPMERFIEEVRPFLGEYSHVEDTEGPTYLREVLLQLRDGMFLLTEVQDVMKTVLEEELDLGDEVLSFLRKTDIARVKEVISVWLELIREASPDPDKSRYTIEQVSQLLALLKKRLTFGGKELFQSLRIAVASTVSGPELKVLIPLIKRSVLIKRAQRMLEKLVELL